VDPEGNVSGTIELVKWDNYSKVAPVGLVVAFMGNSAGDASKELWTKHIHALHPDGMNCT
jgi:hypothetical protein